MLAVLPVLGIIQGRVAHAQTDDRCVGQGAFLTLPYDDNEAMIVLTNGWVYTDGSGLHKGIDYYNSDSTFNIRAAADGRAVVTNSLATDSQNDAYGNFVYIAHPEKDDKGRRYHTLYAHLADGSATTRPGLPALVSKSLDDLRNDVNSGDYSTWTQVKRGEILGKAGKTGLELRPDAHIHLHFEVECGTYPYGKTDPYDIYGTKDLYRGQCGPNRGWAECPPRASSCANLYTVGVPPTGYGASYDTLSTGSLKGELVIESLSCREPSVTITAGSHQIDNQSNQPTQYVYHTGYKYDSTQWQPFEFQGQQLVGNAWYVSHASTVLPLWRPDSTNTYYIVAYTCTAVGSQWKCGCRDSSCAKSYWQLQGFRNK